MKKFILSLTIALFFSQFTYAGQGMINVESQYDVNTTTEKLIHVLNNKGMTVFQHIKHSEAAQNVDIELNNTELVIFGNPKIGSLLMQCAQSVAIDLPQKALIWQDENDKVWLSYNDIDYLKSRHNINGCDKPLGKVKQALANFAKAATE